MGAKDKISIVAIIAVLGRIAQLSNARTASYSSMNLTDTDIIRYFQANVMLEFTFYTAGALGSNIFLVGVVSASAGVKLYPDMYVNGKLLSPEKILSLVRIFILTLALTVSVCWATVGATNGIYWYVVFRRFNYLLSICVVAFISFPVLTFFGSRMNKMIEKTVKVLEKPKPSYTIEASTNDHAVSNNNLGDNVAVPRTAHIKNFKLAISMTIWCMYILTIFNNICLLLGFELDFFQNNLVALLILKCLGDTSLWITTSFISIYLYQLR
ncbi:hypothetical protein HK103_004139 [Boothiomyces macroporosus]|uniref:Uncharacterized protein n=1 Tax=Boothiomyces macroporosus TaxID=261099 RepID=A0AAD5Y8L4_9FUNG|nr:hypothetical protein HK103_004139 [Boothiomyces macroporosus]